MSFETTRLPADLEIDRPNCAWVEQYLLGKINANCQDAATKSQSEAFHQYRVASLDYLLVHNFKKADGRATKKQTIAVALTNRIEAVYYHQLLAYRAFHVQLLRDYYGSKLQPKKYLKNFRKGDLQRSVEYLNPEKIILSILDTNAPNFYIEFFANQQQVELNYAQTKLLIEMEQYISGFQQQLASTYHNLQNTLGDSNEQFHKKVKLHKAHMAHLTHLIDLMQALLDSHQMPSWRIYQAS